MRICIFHNWNRICTPRDWSSVSVKAASPVRILPLFVHDYTSHLGWFLNTQHPVCALLELPTDVQIQNFLLVLWFSLFTDIFWSHFSHFLLSLCLHNYSSLYIGPCNFYFLLHIFIYLFFFHNWDFIDCFENQYSDISICTQFFFFKVN